MRSLAASGAGFASTATRLSTPPSFLAASSGHGARAVVTCARNGGDLQTRRRDIGRLARLLRLDFVDDLSRPEAARFAALHPQDPRAEEAMYCADAVTRGARALEALWLAGHPDRSQEAG